MSNIDISKIRENADIVSVISNYIPLNQKGRNFVGVCPFHNDTSPSLTVSKEKQIYKCFACNAAGNVFTFVQEYEKINFMESVRKVAELTNQKVVGFEKYIKKEVIPKDKEVLFNLIHDLTNFYAYNLNESYEALLYLKDRQMSSEIISKFKVGYAPLDSQKTINFLKAKGYNNDDILNAGVGYEKNGGLVDRYRGRVVFPLFDSNNHPIGFSARKLPSSNEEAKYVNTSETKLFHKSDVLYNYYTAEKISRKIGYVYVLEGFMDVIALSKIGIDNAIAIMGTALTSEHLQKMKKMNCEIRLCFDNDLAGKEATFKNLKLFKGTNLKVQVVNGKSSYKDPDELLNGAGKEALNKYLNELISPMDFNIDYYSHHYNLANYDDKKIFVTKIINEILELRMDEMDANYYLNKVAKLAAFPLDLAINEYNRLKGYQVKSTYTNIKVPTKEVIKAIDRYEEAEKRLIIHMLLDNNKIDMFNERLGIMRNDAYRKIVACIIRYYSEYGKVSYADIFSDISIIQDDEAKKALCNLDFDSKMEEFSEKYFIILTKELELKTQRDLIIQKLGSEKDDKKKVELLKKYTNLEREFKLLKGKL